MRRSAACDAMLVFVMWRPKTFPLDWYSVVVLLMVSLAVLILLIGMTVNLEVFVLIFQSLSNLFICSIARSVVLARNLKVHFFEMICVISSAYAM